MIQWPHAPVHRLSEPGTYMVTAGTCDKYHFFRRTELLELLHDSLLKLAERYHCSLQAWATFSNHYHFVAFIPEAPTLRKLISHLHTLTATEANRFDNSQGRKVRFQYWDTHLTFEKSYLARLNYVHQNAVKHSLALKATAYPYCSAGWFERTASPSFLKTVGSFRTDQLQVSDDFDVLWERD
jgi:putative transposase